MKKYILPIIIFGIFVALPVYAALPSILPECAKGAGVPPLACFLTLLGNVSKWILGISGSLALLYFIYGGFLLLTSRGSQEQVTKGKTILSRAVVGVIIIFGAYTAITFLTGAIGFQESKYKLPEDSTKQAPATPTSISCTCDACEDGFVPKIGAGDVAGCKAVCASACAIHKKVGTPPSCSCVCNNSKSTTVKDLSATPNKNNLTKNCQTFCSLNKSTMKSCN